KTHIPGDADIYQRRRPLEFMLPLCNPNKSSYQTSRCLHAIVQWHTIAAAFAYLNLPRPLVPPLGERSELAPRRSVTRRCAGKLQAFTRNSDGKQETH